MNYTFYIKLADLTVEINTRFDFVRTFCRDYIIEKPGGAPNITASVSPETVAAEMEKTNFIASEEYTECTALYRVIAEQLPKFGCFVFHGAAISYGGRGYLFTAPSGTGKTTHICLWRKLAGDKVDIINGDKPILRIDDNGVTTCSTPWAGKEQWCKNVSMPLGGVCIINRGTDNLCTRQKPSDVLNDVLHQVYLPKNPQCTGLTLEHVDKLLKLVPFYRIACDISDNAAQATLTAMTGEKI